VTRSPQRTATSLPSPTAKGSGDDDGCQVSAAAAPSWSLLLVALAFLVGSVRERRKRRVGG